MNEQWFEKIEDYLSGRMNAEERLHFEKEMATNETLAADFNLYKEIEEEMRDDEVHSREETALKNSTEKLNNIYFPSSDKSTIQTREQNIYPQRKKIKVWKSISIAAGISGIIALGAILYLNSARKTKEVAEKKNKIDTPHLQNVTPSQNLAKNRDTLNQFKSSKPSKNINTETLYAENFEPDVLPEDTEGPLEDAFDDYANKKYKEAIADMDNVDISSVTRGETDTTQIKFYTSYYKAQCYLSIGNAAEAISSLKSALNFIADNDDKIKVNWYLALAYLKIGDRKKANDLLTKIAADKSETNYKKQAEILKEKLNQPIEYTEPN